jgi:hypothetical protein
MNPHKLMICVTIFLGLACLALAQPGPEQLPGKGADEAKKKLPDDPKANRKDPTKASDELKNLLNLAKGGKAANKMPVITLRGRVVAKDQPAAALLDVDGKMITVVKGSVIGGATSMPCTVIELNSREVRIEVMPLKEIISLR